MISDFTLTALSRKAPHENQSSPCTTDTPLCLLCGAAFWLSTKWESTNKMLSSLARACFNYKKNNVWQEQYFNSYWNQAVPHKRSNMQTFLCVIQKEQGLHSWIWPLNREQWSPGFVWVFFIREGGWKTTASCWGHTGLTADWKTTAAGFTALCWSTTTALTSEAEKQKILV